MKYLGIFQKTFVYFALTDRSADPQVARLVMAGATSSDNASLDDEVEAPGGEPNDVKASSDASQPFTPRSDATSSLSDSTFAPPYDAAQDSDNDIVAWSNFFQGVVGLSDAVCEQPRSITTLCSGTTHKQR